MIEAGTRPELAYERLALLAKRNGDSAAALEYAENGWRVRHDARLLELAVNLAFESKQWSRLETILNAATPYATTPSQANTLLSRKAKMAAEKGDMAGALASYQQLLANQPDSVSARAGLLWLLIDHKQKALLGEYIAKWRGERFVDEALADAYATALLSLGRYEEALPHFERTRDVHKNDPFWLLRYADLLSKAGQNESASRLRDHVLAKFHDKLAISATHDMHSAKAYLNLINEKAGAAQRYQAMQYLSENARY